MSLVITPKSEKDLINQQDASPSISEETSVLTNTIPEMRLKEEEKFAHVKEPDLITDLPIHIEEPRKQTHPCEFNEAKNKPEENKLYPPKKRHPGEEKEKKKHIVNKTRVVSEDLSRTPIKKSFNTDKESDLLRTNIYYTKKLYEEVSDLKKTIKRQGYIKYSINLIILFITLMSFYYGVQVMKTVFTGGLSGLMPSMSSSQNVSSSSLQGNLFGQAMKMINTTDNTESSVDKDNINTLLQSEGINVENIINEFLK